MKLKGYFAGFLKYRDLLKELVVRDIKIRYRKSFLGLLWTLLNPLLMMLVLTAVFSFMFGAVIENYPIYYMSGFIMFNFFSESTNMGLTSIYGNSSLIKKIYIPKYLFPTSKVLSCMVNFAFSFVAMLIVMLITQAPFYPTLFLMIIPIFYMFIFALGCTLFLSAVTVFFRDIAHFYGVFMMAWMYLTPLFYPLAQLPPVLQSLMRFNPMYQYVNYSRMLVLEGVVPGLKENLICFSIGAVALIVGIIVFYKKQDKFILHV